MWKSLTRMLAPKPSRMAMLCLLSTTTSLLAQPSLVSVTPANGTTNFDVTQPVEFMFSEEMLNVPPFNIPGFTSYLTWTGLPANTQIDYSWDDPATTLTCVFPDNLPGETSIGWTLNPPGALMPLTSAMGEALPRTTGSFTTGTGQAPCDPDGLPDTYGSVTLVKAATYVQNSTATPSISTETPPGFGVFIQSRATDSITSATYQIPGGSPQAIESAFPGFYIFNDEFTTTAERDAAYPGGSYSVTLVQQLAGSKSVSMTMPGTLPPIPQVANYAATQNVDPDTAFILQWNAFTGADSTDMIDLTISDQFGDVVFQAPDFCAGIELPNTATTITIPAGTFSTGEIYNCSLAFYAGFYQSTNAITEYSVYGAIGNTTEFVLRTGGGVVVTEPGISQASLGTDGSLSFTATNLQPGITYAVETSDTADAGIWSELSTFTAGSSEETVTDPVNTTGNRFYRVVTR